MTVLLAILITVIVLAALIYGALAIAFLPNNKPIQHQPERR